MTVQSIITLEHVTWPWVRDQALRKAGKIFIRKKKRQWEQRDTWEAEAGGDADADGFPVLHLALAACSAWDKTVNSSNRQLHQESKEKRLPATCYPVDIRHGGMLLSRSSRIYLRAGQTAWSDQEVPLLSLPTSAADRADGTLGMWKTPCVGAFSLTSLCLLHLKHHSEVFYKYC